LVGELEVRSLSLSPLVWLAEGEVVDGAGRGRSVGDLSAKERWTRGESSLSTWRARRAVLERRGVGKGMWRVLDAGS